MEDIITLVEDTGQPYAAKWLLDDGKFSNMNGFKKMDVTQQLCAIAQKRGIEYQGMNNVELFTALERGWEEFAARDYNIAGYKNMTNDEIEKAVKYAKNKSDAKLLKIKGYQDMTEKELIKAVECNWRKLEAEKLEIEDYEDLDIEDLYYKINARIWRREFEVFCARRKYVDIYFRNNLGEELQETQG